MAVMAKRLKVRMGVQLSETEALMVLPVGEAKAALAAP